MPKDIPPWLLCMRMVRRFVPSDDIVFSMLILAPVPRASIVMTAATPIMTPSMERMRTKFIVGDRIERFDRVVPQVNEDGKDVAAALFLRHFGDLALCELALFFVGDYFPVLQNKDAGSERGDVRLMRHHYYGISCRIELLEYRHYLV